MSSTSELNKSNPLDIDPEKEIEKVTASLKQALQKDLKKRGLIIAISGGVDSAVSAALCVRALGPKKVYGLLLPEQDSSSDSVSLGELVAKQLGIEYITQNIAPTLEAIGCYQWRDEAMKATFPEYEPDWKSKIVIAGGKEGKINHFQLVVQSPEGEIQQKRLGLKEYLQIVAATNYKQRIRKTVEYFHADRLNYAVVGTPNRLEYDQGFFVKNGDGSADVKPIAHLYKTQVYALARHLGLPEEICNAQPTTDTYSMAQGQDEFYFALPYQQMDLALWAHNHDLPASEAAKLMNIDVEHAEFVYKDIEAKRSATHYLHARPVLVEKVGEVNH
ncbi:MAG: NAD(+) synthase [Gammaproteobacteria bacterium]|nr:NAD(+) synthase [Gammaproteobacteria bacterium]